MLILPFLIASFTIKVGTKPGELPPAMASWPQSQVVPVDPQEVHITKLRQLTFGGENAEAYFDPTCTRLSWQAKIPGFPDDQAFAMHTDGSRKRLISTGTGRCTCTYYLPGDKHIVFSSTYATQPQGQPPIDMSQGYVWMLNPNYVMYQVRPDGTHRKKLVSFPGHYVAETTVDPHGRFMTFTSDKNGNVDIYRTDLKGRHLKMLVGTPGYNGGPFVSWDGKYIVYRSSVFTDKSQLIEFYKLLKKHLIRPDVLEIWMMDSDGKHKRQLTHLGAASFAPFMAPDDQHVIFSSNYGDPTHQKFNLFMINTDGTHLQQITHTGYFNCFPMFSKDGKKLAFVSDRFGKAPMETNIFIANWKM